MRQYCRDAGTVTETGMLLPLGDMQRDGDLPNKRAASLLSRRHDV